LVFYHAGYLPAGGGKPYLDPAAKATLGVSANLMRAFVVIETLNPVQGYAPTRAFNQNEAGNGRIIVHELTGLDQFQVTTSTGTRALGFPAKGLNRNRWASGAAPQGRNFGGAEGFMHRLRDKDGENPAADNWYPFQTRESDAVPIPPGDTKFEFSGGKVRLQTLFGAFPIHQMELDFPSGTFPVPTDDLWQDPGGFQHPDATITASKSLAGRIRWAIQKSNDADTARRWKQILQPGDTIRSMVAGLKSDPRTTAISRVAAAPFVAHPLYADSGVRHAQILRTASGPFYIQGRDTRNRQYTTRFGSLIKLPAGLDYEPDRSPDLPENIDGVVRDDGQQGDFDTGIGNLPDGPYTGKPDEGNLAWRVFNQDTGKWDYMHPYYSWKYEDGLDTFFSPNRQMVSAVLFGSLITGGTRDWETLAFSPNPAGENHRGLLTEPKDHLLLDLFHMPIVEPYAISEPFSTAGKVNLNSQLASFPWIKRTTALRAVLHSSRVTAVPAEDVAIYKVGQNKPPLQKNYRYRINRDETIKGLENRFADYQRFGPDHGFYKSASEICEHFLYPEGATNAGLIQFESGEQRIRDFWKKNRLTGDNVRERPYADLLPRLTTRSNTYTVHFRVQTLRQPRGNTEAAARTWRITSGSITGEYRGETTIERYIDPEDRRFDRANKVTSKNNDFIDVDKQSLEPAYRFRVISSKRFAP
ncbi:MAG: Verru_Chthon cassette protein A, partial [Verrucomicrobiota bacterium]